jgi:predicted AlkP superfamily pyrophosphatase or phosphodiesterase
MKILVTIVDGMRPDALIKTKNAKLLLESSQYSLNARTVTPSVTLPCHMSLFHSVDPSRHGTTTNVFTPNVRPINGLCEVLLNAKKTSAFFYNWEEIRDLSRPNSLAFSYFCKGRLYGYDRANDIISEAAIDFLTKNDIDFTFLYLGYTDMAGHNYGWMSEEYMAAMENSFANISRLYNALPDDYVIIVTADHGGHDRTHGTELNEDMTIPMMVLSKNECPVFDFTGASIKDIAPTVTKLLGVSPDEEWEGKSLLK